MLRDIKAKIYQWRKMQRIWENKVQQQVHKIAINICCYNTVGLDDNEMKIQKKKNNGCKRNSGINCNIRCLQQLYVETDREMLNVCGNMLLNVARNCNLY